jgi:myo-inositol-1(or 4)-monophosphatase
MADFDDYMRVCEMAVRAGGRVVQDWAGRFDVRKKGPADLVTQADFASQEMVRKTVLAAFPDHCLLGEESEPTCGAGVSPAQAAGTAALQAAPQRAEYRWIVDPLDGTVSRIIASRWRWSGTAGCWSARSTIPSSTNASRPSKAAGPY